MIKLFYLLVLLWLLWLLFDGLYTGQIWVKGGAKDRFTRALDMHSFAHKVDRHQQPATYWFHVAFYAAGSVLIVVGLLV